MKSITSELDESIAREWLLDNLSRMDEEDETAAYCVELQSSFDFCRYSVCVVLVLRMFVSLNLEELIAACTFLMQQ